MLFLLTALTANLLSGFSVAANPTSYTNYTRNINVVSFSTATNGVNQVPASTNVQIMNARIIGPLLPAFNATCTGTQILQAPVVSSGIVTNGSCAAQSGGGGSNPWNTVGSDIQNSNSGKVIIGTGGLQLLGLSSNTIAAINASSIAVSMPQLGNGGLIIGDGIGVFPSTGTLTAGAGISITNSPGSITIVNTVAAPYYVLDSSGVVSGGTSISLPLSGSYKHWQGTLWGQPGSSNLTDLQLRINNDSTAADYFSSYSMVHSDTTRNNSDAAKTIPLCDSTVPIFDNNHNTSFIYVIDVANNNSQTYISIRGSYRNNDGINNGETIFSEATMYLNAVATSIQAVAGNNFTATLSMAGSSL